ncbi:MAG: 4Fe-4S ferredoxin [Spirochaetae bacterium HGW-Spirochaetae-3]|jgi:ferredoxin/multimeric flavodoxin WrbA|nr:MAG: 4Fe-4S ferredoxin [Spirochaetae bacterium HGW-Spirochaetae-3]
MNVSIVNFSPSGNTMSVSRRIRDALLDRDCSCQLVDLTGDARCFIDGAWRRALENTVREHDVLLVGGPVYAHHLHYNVKRMIEALPPPGEGWGKIAIPFVTYGGVSSGIALKEAGASLRRSGRTVVAGMKVAASHKMTRAFLEREFNADIPERPMLDAVNELAARVVGLNLAKRPRDARASLAYNGLESWIKATFVFDEQTWHRERYPNVSVDALACTGCGACARSCPVLHLRKNADGAMEATQGDCIHCLNCVVSCPTGAIRLIGDLDKGREFMAHMIEHHANKEKPATAVYPR